MGSPGEVYAPRCLPRNRVVFRAMDPSARSAPPQTRWLLFGAVLFLWLLAWSLNLFEVMRTHCYGQSIASGLRASATWHRFDYLETGVLIFLGLLFTRMSRPVGGGVLLGLVGISLFLRLLQLAGVYFSHALLGDDTFRHAAVSFAFASPAMLGGLLGAGIGAGVVWLWGVRSLARAPGCAPSWWQLFGWGFGPCLFLLAGIGGPALKDPLPARGKLSAFATDLVGFWLRVDTRNRPRRPSLEAADLVALQRFGIEYPGPSEAPLWHAPRWKTPVPRRAGLRPAKNVVVVFFESLSARLIGPYNPAIASWTPGLNDFAKEAMVVEDYFNHAGPTFFGLRGAMCSWYPVLGWEDWMELPASPSRVLGFPQILADKGFHTAFLSPPPAAEGRFSEQLERYGIRERIHRDQVLELAGKKAGEAEADSIHYPNDARLFRAARAWIEARSNASKPFFLGMLTVDTHPPYDEPGPSGRPEMKTDLGRVVAGTDAAFGEFWQWFKDSPWAENTILVLTADHAPSPSGNLVREPRLGQDYRPFFFDRIPMMIRDPGLAKSSGRLRRLSNASDLAPTILHLLEIREETPFQGYSLWDPKWKRDRTVGVKVEHRFRFHADSGARWQRNLNRDPLPSCEEDPEACLLERWTEYQRDLLLSGRIRP